MHVQFIGIYFIILSLYIYIYIYIYIYYLTTTVDCGPPSVPRNGSLQSYTITTEGSVVFYSCDPGLVPEGRRRAVCTENGWSPDPTDL